MRIWITAILLASAALGQDSGGGTIKGQVEDQTGAAIAGVSVRLLSSQLSPREAKAGPIGEFTFEGVTPGRYRLYFSSPGFEERVLRAEIAKDQSLDLRRVRLLVTTFSLFGPPVQIRLVSDEATTGAVAARIVDGESVTALPNARVVLRCPTRRDCSTKTTNSNGDVRFENLVEGEYRMTISAKGFYPWDFSFDVTAGFEFSYREVALERCVEPTCNPKKRPGGVMLE
ncbi:MAG: carboxypeptidase-like regulatory domain-containing protein [Bryobacteraceae bacterium]